MIKLFKREIENEYTRQNFINLESYVNNEPLLKGNFKFFEVSLVANSYPTKVAVKHHLGFVPRDVIITSEIGAGSYAIDYVDFDNVYIYVTITGPIALRMFLGTYFEGKTI